jgi:putative addiction module killer protein
VIRRIIRLESGNFGDHKFIGDGVSEFRIDVGPGYRVYFGMAGMKRVVLLVGGSKNTQQRDIERAKLFWQDYQQRNANH